MDLTRRVGIIPCGYDVVKHLYEKKPLAVGNTELPHYVRTAQKRALVGNIEF